MITYQDESYRYRVAFNPETGVYIRTSVLNDQLIQTTVEPFRASYPHLLDVGIMGHCLHGISGKCASSKVQCYQSGNSKKEAHMSLDNYKKLIDQSINKTFQIALGGRGDPNQHPDFLEIIAYAFENGIVPNFTTSGFDFDFSQLPLIKKYCKAVAVSYYGSVYTDRAIQALLAYGIKTNIHFVLGNNTIDEAIDWVENKKIAKGVNRVIYLLHKPVGNGKNSNVLQVNDPKVQYFYSLFNKEENCKTAGFDTCSAPGLIHHAPNILKSSYDTCEGGRFSAYVTPDYQLLPCSFDTELKFSVDLHTHTVKEAFNSEIFDRFRNRFKQPSNPSKLKQDTCNTCEHQSLCMGGCPLMNQVVLCEQLQATIKEVIQ